MPTLRHAIFLSILIAGFILLASKATANSPYLNDEADYCYAAKLGIAANFLDSPTMPVAEFIRIGLSRGKDPQQAPQLSALIPRGPFDSWPSLSTSDARGKTELLAELAAYIRLCRFATLALKLARG